MNRAKCHSSSKDGLNDSRIEIACNRERNLIGNQLAWRSNPRKFNINWAFKRVKWLDVNPKHINSFVNGVNNDFLIARGLFDVKMKYQLCGKFYILMMTIKIKIIIILVIVLINFSIIFYFYNDNECAVKRYVVQYLWAGNKNGIKSWVVIAIIIIIIIVMNMTIIIVMVSDNTGGYS